MWHLIERNGGKIPPLLSFSGVKWMGGSLTNWDSISRMACRYAHIFTQFDRFILKNRIHLPRYDKMERAHPGFLQMGAREIRLRLKKRPDLLIIMNPNGNRHILEECYRLNIPVIALVDSNINSSKITVPIPINPDSLYWPNKLITDLINLSLVVHQCSRKGRGKPPLPC
jgi:small subunit ribosomal protein S2